MWARLAKEGATFGYLDEPLAIYRLHDSNMCKNMSQMGKFFVCASLEIARMIDDDVLRKQFGEAVDAHLQASYYRVASDRLEKVERVIAKLNRFPRVKRALSRWYGIIFSA